MADLVQARQAGQVPDTLLLLEHESVITLGRGGKREHVLAGPAELDRLGVRVETTARGGDVTLHAPGQLVAYPVLDLAPDRRDVRRYVQDLTRVMNALIGPYGAQGGTLAGMIGLWVDAAEPGHFRGEGALAEPRKIGAIGVRISRWVTSHGFALNLTTDLDLFRLIVPCGISALGVTSLEQLSGRALSVHSAAEQARQQFGSHFERDVSELFDLSGLGAAELGRALLEAP